MSEPGDELTPLPDDPEEKPKLSRSPYVALGVAALVISTVFATVAALASTREDEQAAPSPQSDEGTVETSTPETYTTDPTSTSAPGSSQSKKPAKHKKDGSATGNVDNGEDATTDDEGTTSGGGGGGGTATRPGQPSPKPPTTTKPSPKPPSADIGGGCPETGLDCSFDGSGSTDPDGSITKYEWSFGDGEFGTGENVGHHYNNPGTYTVKLTVTDSQGLKSSKTTEFTVVAASITSGN
jgi:hypothetical protein